MTDKELEAFEATRDIEAEILQGIDDMLANNASKRAVVTEKDVALARKKLAYRRFELLRWENDHD